MNLLVVIGITPSRVAAVNYSEGTYGAGVYQQVESASLANTGQPFQLIAGIAAVCIGSGGLILSLTRSRKRHQTYQNNQFS